jgi:hypothetical protein
MTVDRVIGLILLARRSVGSRPLVVFAASLAIVAIFYQLGLLRDRQVGRLHARLWVAVAAIAAYTTIVVWYTLQLQYADAAEPTIGAVAWLFKVGQPIYHAPESAERYSHIYGPLAFIIPAWCLSLFGPGIITSKVNGAIAGLSGVAMVFALARAAVDRRRAIGVAGLFAVICLMFQGVSFWNRPDSLLALLSAAALWIAVRVHRPPFATVALGLITGMLIDLKITGVLYALPAFALLIGESRIRMVLLAALVSACVAVVPFLAYSNVSLANYLHWLSVSAANGLVFLTFKRNAEWAVFLMLPLVPALMWSTANRRERWLGGALIAGIAMTVIAASKPGAGAYHLLPFVPVVLYSAAVTWGCANSNISGNRHMRLAVLAFIVTVGVIATLQTAYFIFAATQTRGMSLASDLNDFVQAHPDRRIEMGYAAENESFAYVRPILVFHEGAYLVDAPAIQEFQMSGLDLPAATVQAIESCAIDLWLFPRDGTPFSVRNRYPSTGHVPVFPERFRTAFGRSYHPITSTKYFEVWGCRAAPR